ncbi:unnamed protein product [Effrenium voratum]|nr:unnamed protein product [Effrenium voratum]
MGRRRARAGPVSKPRIKLDTMFDCLFCSSLKAVEADLFHPSRSAQRAFAMSRATKAPVKMVRLEKIGFLKCRVCSANFSSPISYLSEAVDVYSDWVDKCAEVNYEPEADEPAAKKTKV